MEGSKTREGRKPQNTLALDFLIKMVLFHEKNTDALTISIKNK